MGAWAYLSPGLQDLGNWGARYSLVTKRQPESIALEFIVSVTKDRHVEVSKVKTKILRGTKRK